MTNLYKFLFILIINLGFSQTATLDSTFNIGTGANGTVNGIVQQPDGKIVVVGDFSIFNGTPANRVIRLNQNGSYDPTFDFFTGPNGAVHSIAIQSNGKLIIGGNFTNFDGTAKGNIARLKTDGSLDNTFNASLNDSPDVIKILSDDTIIVCGNFTYCNAPNRNRIAKLDIDGNLITTFSTGINSSNGFDNWVKNICIQPDNKVLAVGTFSTFGVGTTGVTRNKMARLNQDGSLDTSFYTSNSGVNITNSPIENVAILPNNDIIVVGGFTNNGTSGNKIGKVSFSTGIFNSSFTANTTIGASDPIYSVLALADNKILIAGAFSTYNGISRSMLARVNNDGSLDTSFNVGTGFSGSIGFINKMYLQNDGKLYVMGFFTNYNGTTVTNLVRLTNVTLSNSDFTKTNKFSISPNPTNSILNIATQETLKYINIIDLLGRKTNITNFENNTIDVSKLQNGIYFIEIATENGLQTQKFIKN
jgi:uncharacterized delta-60 repeat protein